MRSSKLNSVPFIKQTENHCGPASLAMVLEFNNQKKDLKELSSLTMTPGSKGTFSTDLITAVRRKGMLPLKVNDIESLIIELSADNPILVLQNVGLSWMPKWHYAVVVGHDLNGPDIILHTGDKKFHKLDMRFFERSWSLGNFWGIVIIEPGKIAPSVSDLGHVEGISGLEQLKKFDKAQRAYTSVLKKWPKSLPALIGISNVLYEKKDYKKSVYYLKEAAFFHQDSAVVLHNLATAQNSAGFKSHARKNARKALELVSENDRKHFQISLHEILKD
jgi:tetratricopeptide (TPR) repeat protein